MPNILAYVALIIWPIVSFKLFKKLKPIPATFWTILGGFLILPVRVEIDFPLLPPFDKESISAIAALVGYKYISKKNITLIPTTGLERWLFVVLLILPFITVINNQEVAFYKEGLTYYDALSIIIIQYIRLIPFLLGAHLIKSHKDQLEVFQIVVIAALLYSLPILFEIRMSPQLHNWTYGFFPHTWGQQKRFGGFRSVVFLGHGLIVAMFVAIALGCVAMLWKEKIKVYNFSASIFVVYLFVVLLLSKTVGAALLGIVLVFSIGWLPVNIIKRLALFIMFIVIFYPALCIFDYFPHQQLLDIVLDFDAERAQSLAFRFYNENEVLQNAQQKLFFGWGGWGRNMKGFTIDGDLTRYTVDGYWIILFGKTGITGFSAIFGLAALSVWKGLKSIRLLKDENERRLIAGHLLLVAVIMVDQLPNASLGNWLWFLIGALLGRANNIIKEHKTESGEFVDNSV